MRLPSFTLTRGRRLSGDRSLRVFYEEGDVLVRHHARFTFTFRLMKAL